MAGVASALGGEGKDGAGSEVGGLRRGQVLGEHDDRFGQLLEGFGVLAKQPDEDLLLNVDELGDPSPGLGPTVLRHAQALHPPVA